MIQVEQRKLGVRAGERPWNIMRIVECGARLWVVSWLHGGVVRDRASRPGLEASCPKFRGGVFCRGAGVGALSTPRSID